MAKSDSKKMVFEAGNITFFIGLFLVLFFGLGFAENFRSILMGIIFGVGIIIGLINITAEEVTPYMYAGTILVLVSFLGITIVKSGMTNEMPIWIKIIVNTLEGVLLLFVPMTIAVSLKSVFAMAKSK